MRDATISFIGAGHMATSLIKGLLADGYPAKNIWVTDLRPEQLKLLEDLHIHKGINNRSAVQFARTIILAVKPQALKKVAHEISDLILEKKHLIISIAAGISLKMLKNYFANKNSAFIRCMPNTPALLGCGVTGLFANKQCSPAQKTNAESIFRSVGTIIWLKKEIQLDTVTALSGSGPAYFFLLIEALQKAGVKLGLSQKDAALLTLQTALGAARMAIESNQSIEQLIQNVTSPGGTTECALERLHEGGFLMLIQETVQAAKQRAEELAKQF